MGFVGGYRHIEQVRVVRFIAARSLASLMSRPDSILKQARLISPILIVSSSNGRLSCTDGYSLERHGFDSHCLRRRHLSAIKNIKRRKRSIVAMGTYRFLSSVTVLHCLRASVKSIT